MTEPVRALALITALAMCGCAAGPAPAPDPEAAAVAEPEYQPGDRFTIHSGVAGAPLLRVEVIATGDGPRPAIGDTVAMHYTGTFIDGRKFDSSRDRGEPFVFPVGYGKVIKGWDRTVPQMRVGDRWKVTVPFQAAYGDRGHPAGIPPRANLVFDMELVEIL